MINIASYIDHTILKPVTTYIEIKKICEEAVEYGFAAVCIPPPLVSLAVESLRRATPPQAADQHTDQVQNGSKVKVATVIGFPFGYSVAKAKLAETEQALADGAEELDIVINLVALKNGNWETLTREMALVTDLVHDQGKIVKVIIESGILQDDEIIRCCEIYSALRVDFLKTSTGYAEKGATIAAVQLMRQHLPASIQIKASGGIRDYTFARQLIAAGANRLGCSASVAIVTAQSAEKTDY